MNIMSKNSPTAAVARNWRLSRNKTHQSTLYDLMQESGSFNNFTDLINRAGLKGEFNFMENLTVFAPSDEAFSASATDMYSVDFGAPSSHDLARFVRQFVVSEQGTSSRFEGRRTWATTRAGQKFLINGTREITYQGVKLARVDILATNGILHVINRMIVGHRFYNPFELPVRPRTSRSRYFVTGTVPRSFA